MTRHWPFYIFAGVLIFAAFVQSYLSSAPAEAPSEAPAEAPVENPKPGDSPKVESVGQRQPVMPTRLHVDEDQTVIYNTVPPTSGNHWARWAKCGFYEEGLPDELIVHNLEHSIIIISYNLTTEAEVAELRNAVNSIAPYRKWGLSRFYDKIPSGTVAMAAWGVLDMVDRIDRDRIQQFFNEYAGNEGLERIPCATDPSQLQL